MTEKNLGTITLGGGCFWCLEAVFDELAGVTDVVSGYAGGTIKNPTYREICSGLTGHAEVVQVSFKPDELSIEDLLRVFFTVHNPTELNRQGPDVGSQYRSVVFYHSDEQRKAAEHVIDELEKGKIWGGDPIVTQVEPIDVFWTAEDYHQEYFSRNPDQGYCRVIVAPKVAKFRQAFADRLRP